MYSHIRSFDNVDGGWFPLKNNTSMEYEWKFIKDDILLNEHSLWN